jgi:outer membrane immunogenic protein
MAKLNLKQIAFLILAVALASCMGSWAAHAADITQNMNGLGGDKDLMKKARALDPDNRVRVVQNRTVDRNWRMELGVGYGALAGGNPYLDTQDYGVNFDVHINPMFSVGARYNRYYNKLNSEGDRVFADAQRHQAAHDDTWHTPAVDYLNSSEMATLSFYPIYGKLNMLDMGITQFDLYMIGGYGQAHTENGSSPTWTAGGGAGIWLSQHFASRLEVRYQSYQEKIYSGSRDVNAVVSTFSIGFML